MIGTGTPAAAFFGTCGAVALMSADEKGLLLASTTRVLLPSWPSTLIAVKPVGVVVFLMTKLSSPFWPWRVRVVLCENSRDSKLSTVTSPVLSPL